MWPQVAPVAKGLVHVHTQRGFGAHACDISAVACFHCIMWATSTCVLLRVLEVYTRFGLHKCALEEDAQAMP